MTCKHTAIHRVIAGQSSLTKVLEDRWECANPSCREAFVPSSAVQQIIDRQTEVLDGVAATMSAVMWDQTERMTEWLLSHGATKEEAEPEETKGSFFLDADQHKGEQ